MFPKLVLVLFLPFCLAHSQDVTFKNVTFRGYSFYTEKFKKTIPLSNSLKEFLPDSEYDQIEFVDQNIPVLYENSLADLDDLDELDFENCGIIEIRPGALKNVPKLTTISLKGNKIQEIKQGVFNNLQLTTIDLTSNLLTTIHTDAFNDMPNLQSIDLSNNNIAEWHNEWFKNTPVLTRVSLKNNSIATIPSHAFKNFVGNKTLNSVKLQVNIILSKNQITTIHPEAFSGLTEVGFLWLDHNKLQEFDGNLLIGIEIENLGLNGNRLRCLDGDLAKIIKAEKTDLDLNPFDCDCLRNIQDWAKKNNKKVDLFFSDLKCAAHKNN